MLEETDVTTPKGVCNCCRAPSVPFGLFCAACYGSVLHPEGLPMEPGDPSDPWRKFNAEADALILDNQMPCWAFKPTRCPKRVPHIFDGLD